MYDYDFKYGENFYVCITEAAKELILNVRSLVLETQLCTWTIVLIYVHYIVSSSSSSSSIPLLLSPLPSLLPLKPPPEELEGAGKDGGEAEEEEIPKTPEPKEWIGQGSELEIAEAALHTARPLVGLLNPIAPKCAQRYQ